MDLQAFKQSLASSQKLKQLSFLYNVFWLFARQGTLLCFCFRFVVIGVVLFSIFAGVVGEVRLTAVMNAA